MCSTTMTRPIGQCASTAVSAPPHAHPTRSRRVETNRSKTSRGREDEDPAYLNQHGVEHHKFVMLVHLSPRGIGPALDSLVSRRARNLPYHGPNSAQRLARLTTLRCTVYLRCRLCTGISRSHSALQPLWDALHVHTMPRRLVDAVQRVLHDREPLGSECSVLVVPCVRHTSEP